MGVKQSLIYSIPITEKIKENETQIFRNPFSKNSFTINFEENIKTLQDIFKKSLENFPSNKLIGFRNEDGIYTFKTYKEVYNLALQIGSCIIDLNLAQKIKYGKYEFNAIGVYSKNREEWLLVDYAGMLYNIVIVPIYDALGKEAIISLIKQTEIKTIFCSLTSLKNLQERNMLGELSNYVCFDENFSSVKTEINEIGGKIYGFNEMIESHIQIKPLPIINENDIFTVSYTSGTIDVPKGALISNKNILAAITSLIKSDIPATSNDVHLSYLPLPHIYERLICIVCMKIGACIGVYSGDVVKLKLDLQDLRPTFFGSVPRLYNKFYDVMSSKLNNLNGINKIMANRAIQSKQYYLKNGCYYSNKFWDFMIFNKIKQAFGGRTKWMLTASAPISKNVIEFLKIACSCPIFEFYGLTETTGASFLTKINDSESCHFGPTLNTEFKIVDVQEMDYLTSYQDEEGTLKPRGELLLRGPMIFNGYLKDQKRTDEVLIEDNWFKTGDIVELQPQGSIKIIDRRKNIFKLAHGEYIAPEKLENIYQQCNLIKEIFVYGESYQSFLISIVFPDNEYIKLLAEKLNLIGDFDDLIKNAKIIEFVQKEIDEIGKKNGLFGFEMIKKIHLISQSMGTKNLLTQTYKIKRNLAKQYFKDIIETLYDVQD